MRQIKEWIQANGGPPAVVIVGAGCLALWVPLGLALIALGVLWFVVWMEPVRKLLIRFLSWPDDGATTPETGPDRNQPAGVHVNVEEGATLIQHIHPPDSPGDSQEGSS
jgi:hypothetical protein